jgi:hypothetical protein
VQPSRSASRWGSNGLSLKLSPRQRCRKICRFLRFQLGSDRLVRQGDCHKLTLNFLASHAVREVSALSCTPSKKCRLDGSLIHSASCASAMTGSKRHRRDRIVSRQFSMVPCNLALAGSALHDASLWPNVCSMCTKPQISRRPPPRGLR